MDCIYFPHQVFLHAICSELVANFLGILVPDSAVAELAFPEGLDYLVGQGFCFDVEPIVPVRRLAFECLAFILGLNTFPLNDNRIALLDLYAVLLLKPVNCDLEMKFTHTCEKCLSSFAVGAHL